MLKPSILLAEDHDLVRAGFKAILEAEKQINVIAEAKNGETALQLVLELKPDVLIIDLSLPKLSGLAVISQLRKTKNFVKVFVLTAAEAPNVWKEALDLGVKGIALKSISKEELLQGVQTVMKDEIFVHSEMKQALEAFIIEKELLEAQVPEEEEAKPKKPVKISVREKQIIKLVAEGYKTKEIADVLGISDRTVSKHRENIMTKLGFTASAEMVNYANHIGLLKVLLNEIK